MTCSRLLNAIPTANERSEVGEYNLTSTATCRSCLSSRRRQRPQGDLGRLHPHVRGCRICAELHLDDLAGRAALLHDVVEDTESLWTTYR